MIVLLRYWWALVLAAVIGGVYWHGYRTGHNAAELACRGEIDTYKKFSRFLDKKLEEALSKPQAPKVKEVIRANPSHCDVPKPVADGLREAIRAANAAE